MAQNYGRRTKPLPWNVSYGGVAPDCRWSWDGLVLGWPIWGGLKSCAALSIDDPIRGRSGFGANSTVRSVVGEYRGPALYGDNGSVAAFGLVMVGDSAWLPTTECTVVLQKRRRDGNASYVAGNDLGLLTGGGGVAQHLALFAPFSDGTLYFRFGGDTEGVSRLSVAGLTYGDNVFVVTSGARGMEVWQDGALVASNAATPTRTASTAQWGIGEAQAGGKPDNANYGALLVYNRQLSIRAIRALSLDPWTPFRPARQTVQSSAAVSTTIARVTQAALEALIALPVQTRATQVLVEALIAAPSTPSTARLSTLVVEAFTHPDATARLTQLAVEVFSNPTPGVRVTQVDLEALLSPDPIARVTQVNLEALVQVAALTPTYTGQLFPRGSPPPF